MDNGHLSFMEFKAYIDKIDKYYQQYFNNLDSIEKKEKSEIEEFDKKTDDYIKSLVKNRVNALKKFQDNINELLTKLHESGFSLSTFHLDYKHEKFNDLNQALKVFKDRIDSLNNKLQKLNDYDIKSSTFSYNFDGEKVVINGQEYSAPNFPNINLDTLDTDKEYREAIKDVLEEATLVYSSIEFLIGYYSSSNYLKDLEGNKNDAKNQFLDDLRVKYTKEKDRLLFDATSVYKNDYSPFLLENEANLSDYVSASNLIMPEVFNSKINIGSLPYKFNNYKNYNKVIKSIDTSKVINENITFPYYLDLMNKGSILINSNGKDENLVNFVHQLIFQFVSSFPYKKLSLALVDVDDIDEFDFTSHFIKDYLIKNNLLFTGNIASDEDSFKNMVISLNQKINDIKGKLSQKYCKNIFEYNDISPENTEEMHLMVYVNCPKCMNSTIADRIVGLAFNGKTTGVYSIVLNDRSLEIDKDSYSYNQDTHNKFIEKLSNYSTIVEYNVKSKTFTMEKERFTPNFAFKEENTDEVLKKLHIDSQNAANHIVYLDSLLGKDFPRKEYYEEIKIPVGKQAGEIGFFSLDIKGKSHAIIAGKTGSGKSSLLHSIILSGSYYYSPDELEFYLIDFKNGTEFGPYLNKDTGESLIPHISFFSLKNKIEDAFDILVKIENEMLYRSNYFNLVHAQELDGYQKHPDVVSGKLPSFKRLLILIDEYQNFLEDGGNTNLRFLCNRCAEKLESLLRLTRAYGISIILSSQTIAVERTALAQIANRYILETEAMQVNAAFPNANVSSDDIVRELSKEKGLVYKTTDEGNSLQLFRAGYTGKIIDPRAVSIIDSICKKWNVPNRKPMVSGSLEPLPIYKSNAPFVKFDKLDNIEKNKIKAYFGVSALSNELVNISITNKDFSNYVILGDLEKVRSIEMSLGLSFLYHLKQANYDIDSTSVYYFDLNESEYAKEVISPYQKYQDELSELVTYARGVESVGRAIDELYQEFLLRKEASKSDSGLANSPKLLIINSYSWLHEKSEEYLESYKNIEEEQVDYGDVSDNSELIGGLSGINASSMRPTRMNDDGLSLEEKVIKLYENGFYYNIFVIIHDIHAEYLSRYDRFAKLTLAISCSKDECANCSDITFSDLAPTYAVLFPEVSKVRPFIFDGSKQERETIDKFVKEMNK